MARTLLLVALAVFFCQVGPAPAQTVQQPALRSISDYCFAAKDWPEKGRLGSAFEQKVRRIFSYDLTNVGALLYAFPQACRTDLISLSPTPAYTELLHSLQRAREEYESTGTLSQATMVAFERQGVVKRTIPTRRAGAQEWQLIINPEVLPKLNIRSAADLSSNGLMFIEAYHQLSRHSEFAAEQRIFLDAIEMSAREIIDHSDENNDGIVGWGRLWFKIRDGVILHSSEPLHNLYFGGYTYFPREDALGRPTCERTPALKEEAFDQAYNDLFLLEAYLVTRDRRLAEEIIRVVGKSFDSTFDDGGKAGPNGTGWYYWKQLGTATGTGQPKCVAGRQIKNTNLRMGVALRLYGEIIRRNAATPTVRNAGIDVEKYLQRAKAVISANDFEIFANNNFGYQGVETRRVELTQEPTSTKLLYDRTQKTVDLDLPFLRELNGIIAAGNGFAQQKSITGKAVLCSGDSDTPIGDVSTGSSCWNHLAFEAQDYFRLMRYENLWSSTKSSIARSYIDAMVRNLAAANLVLDGRTSRYARCFPAERGVSDIGETIEVAQYAYFCMARKVSSQPAVRMLPKPHLKFLERAQTICDSAPPESLDKWRRGHTFYELYMSTDRLQVPAEDWLLARKFSVAP